MMQKLKVLKIIFEGELKPYEIPAFRGAMAKKAGWENLLFHNHKGDGFRYRYPLIQYKCIRRQPAILCIGEGVDEIHHFFSKKSWDIRISERDLSMKIDRLDMNQFTMQVWDQQFQYNMHNWVALNQKSYPEYLALDSLTDKIRYLERKLIGNILSMAKGIDWYIDKPVEVKITDLREPRRVKAKGVPVLAFNLNFRSNVFLPNDFGLGKHASLGYGVVRKEKTEQFSKVVK